MDCLRSQPPGHLQNLLLSIAASCLQNHHTYIHDAIKLLLYPTLMWRTKASFTVKSYCFGPINGEAFKKTKKK